MVLSHCARRDNIEARGTWSSEQEKTSFARRHGSNSKARGNPYYATARLWDDGVIDHADTRNWCSSCLSAPTNAPDQAHSFGPLSGCDDG